MDVLILLFIIFLFLGITRKYNSQVLRLSFYFVFVKSFYPLYNRFNFCTISYCVPKIVSQLYTINWHLISQWYIVKLSQSSKSNKRVHLILMFCVPIYEIQCVVVCDRRNPLCQLKNRYHQLHEGQNWRNKDKYS